MGRGSFHLYQPEDASCLLPQPDLDEKVKNETHRPFISISARYNYNCSLSLSPTHLLQKLPLFSTTPITLPAITMQRSNLSEPRPDGQSSHHPEAEGHNEQSPVELNGLHG